MRLRPWITNWWFKKKSIKKITPPEPEDLKDSTPLDRSNMRVTGNRVTYIIPDDMKSLKVQILKGNGTYVNEYNLSRYITMKPGWRIKIIVE